MSRSLCLLNISNYNLGMDKNATNFFGLPEKTQEISIQPKLITCELPEIEPIKPEDSFWIDFTLY